MPTGVAPSVEPPARACDGIRSRSIRRSRTAARRPGVEADRGDRPPTAHRRPTATPSPGRRGRPIPSPEPEPEQRADATPPPAIEPVAPRSSARSSRRHEPSSSNGRLRVSVTLPAAPGRYRLVTTVHGADGIAFDAATQVLVPVLTVRVSRPVSAAYGVDPTPSPGGGRHGRPARPGGQRRFADLGEPRRRPRASRSTRPSSAPTRRPARRPLDPARSSAPGLDGLPDVGSPIDAAPGAEVTVDLGLIAPTVPGDYLLAARRRQPTPRLAGRRRRSVRAGPRLGRRGGRVPAPPARPRAGHYSRGALIRRPRREIAPVASAATPIAISLRSGGGRERTADRN